jgi:predicted CoA-binding protein
MEAAIQTFINSKRLALVGVSRGGKKFGNMAHKELKARGYQTFIVHPQAAELGGERCYPNLAALSGKVDGVWICVPPKQATEVLREAVAAGMRNIWLQQGSESPEVLKLARELGLSPISGKCILMYAPPVGSFHKFHRLFARLFGKL